MTTTTITAATTTTPFPAIDNIVNLRRGAMNDPTQMLLAVWMDHLADGHSTTRMRSTRGGSTRPISFR